MPLPAAKASIQSMISWLAEIRYCFSNLIRPTLTSIPSKSVVSDFHVIFAGLSVDFLVVGESSAGVAAASPESSTAPRSPESPKPPPQRALLSSSFHCWECGLDSRCPSVGWNPNRLGSHCASTKGGLRRSERHPRGPCRWEWHGLLRPGPLD